MAKEKLFFVGIKGLIEDEQGRILLLLADVSTHRKNVEPYWDIPGGRVKEGSSVEETLQREIAEETGVTEIIDPQFLTAVVSNHEVPTDDGYLAGLILMVYRVKIPAGSTITISEEHSEYAWFTRAEAAEKLAHKYPPEFTISIINHS